MAMTAPPSSSPASRPGRRGGLLLRVEAALCFIPASVAVRVAPPPRVTAIPGAPPELCGVTLYEGVIVPVIAIGSARREMVVCLHAGELVGLVGGHVVQSGSFDLVAGRGDRVMHEGQPAQMIDLTAIYGRVLTSARPARWAR
jgi:CheW-like domain